ncbi:hypothetical protein ACHAWF_004978 [Thalassiosira exigua]
MYSLAPWAESPVQASRPSRPRSARSSRSWASGPDGCCGPWGKRSRDTTKNGGGAPGKTLGVEDVARIVAEGANPPVADQFGLPDGWLQQFPMLELDAHWIFLERYCTAANRGGGFLYSYLLKNAVPIVPGGGTVNYAGAGDAEAQEILYLSEEEIVEELSRGGGGSRRTCRDVRAGDAAPQGRHAGVLQQQGGRVIHASDNGSSSSCTYLHRRYLREISSNHC